jgi:large conductance mechanosensitive channel
MAWARTRRDIVLKDLFDEFKAFIARGNVLDLAVAVVLGVAFGAVVRSFTDDVLMAIIGAVFGKPNFNTLTLDIGDGVVLYGRFLTELVNFLLIAFGVFVVVKAISALQRARADSPEEAPAPSDEALLLAEIRDLLASGRS